jgi:hypothetical protein
MHQPNAITNFQSAQRWILLVDTYAVQVICQRNQFGFGWIEFESQFAT